MVNNSDTNRDINKKYNEKNIIEHFDGIRKDNSRIIFGCLLTIIIINILVEFIY